MYAVFIGRLDETFEEEHIVMDDPLTQTIPCMIFNRKRNNVCIWFKSFTFNKYKANANTLFVKEMDQISTKNN
jgi:hypothetical protein